MYCPLSHNNSIAFAINNPYRLGCPYTYVFIAVASTESFLTFIYGGKGQIQNEKIKINILKDGTLDIGNSFWAAADQIKFKGSEQYLLLPENENDLKIIDIMSDMTDSFESSGYHFKTGPVVEFRNLEHIHAQTHI